MKHITPQDIERWLRFPESLGRNDYIYIREQLGLRKDLQEVKAWYADFYDLLDDLNRPLHLRLTHEHKEQSDYPFYTLAAKSVQTKAKAFKTVATFVDERNKTLVRVLKNQVEQLYELHAISTFIKSTDRLMIQLQPSELLFFTQAGGKLKRITSRALNTLDWSLEQLFLSFPVQVFSLDQHTSAIKEADFELLVEGDRCTLSWSQSRVSHVLVEHQNGEEYYTIRARSLSLEMPRLPSTLYLYA